MTASASRSAGSRWPLLPILLVPVLLPVGRTSELGTLIGLLAGLWLLWRHGSALRRMPGVRLLALLFAAYAGAALLSLPDSVTPARSWGTFAAAWRFLPFGLYVCWSLRETGPRQWLYRCMALLLVLWAVDAWVQVLTGWSLGGPAGPLRISGVFGADNLKLGPVLATLSPFLLWVALQRWGWRGVAAAFVLLLVPVIMAGSRQAWIEYALVGVAFAWRLGRTPQGRSAWLAGAAVIAAVVMTVAWYGSPRFAQRIERSVQVLAGSEQGLDTALSGRVYIWRTGLRMLAAHPINGVGVRGFRYAYPDYAVPGDPFMGGQRCGPDEGACHPHQWLLEVADDCGLLGLVAWLAGIGLALRAWKRAGTAAREQAWPVSLALAVALFPLNTHLAFYSAWWGLLFWWLLSVWCATLHAAPATLEVPREPT